MVNARASYWAGIWCKRSDTDDKVAEDLALLRKAAVERPLPELTLRQMEAGLARIRDSKGADNVQPALIQALPIQGKLELLQLLRDIAYHLVLPVNQAAAFMVLKAKPTGGDRTLALFCMMLQADHEGKGVVHQ